MFAIAAVQDVPYAPRGDAIAFSNLRHRLPFGPQVPYLYDLSIGQLCPMVDIALWPLTREIAPFLQHILGVVMCSANEQMLWVYAQAHIAVMTYKHAVRHTANKHSVGQTMSEISSLPLAWQCHSAIALDVYLTQPYPASKPWVKACSGYKELFVTLAKLSRECKILAHRKLSSFGVGPRAVRRCGGTYILQPAEESALL